MRYMYQSKNQTHLGWFIVMMMGLTIVGCSTPQESTHPKPNVIFILADDLGYGDLSCYGQQHFKTPNIDRLAQQGMRFSQHYSGATVCAPSRSALLTGMHTGHTPIRGNKEIQPEGQHPLPDSLVTLAEVFKSAGYKTGAFGKWGLGFPGSEGDPNNQGFDEFYGYNCQRLAHHYYPYFLRHNESIDSLPENSGKSKGTYAPEVIHEHALQFMENHQDEPFFMFYPSAIPHAEMIAPDSVMDKYRGKYLPERAYEGVDDGPEYRKGPYESQEEAHAAFVAMMDVLDRQVGEILAKVEALGMADRTIIVFTSDNGPHREAGADPNYFSSNGPLKGYKRDLYEGGIRVPLIVSWPGKITPGAKSAHVSAFWDFLPTFRDLVGLEANDSLNLDGISMAPTLLGQANQPKHEYLYWEFHEKGGRQAIRKGKWKAVRYNVFEDRESTPELYDLSEDIGEEYNVADEYPEVAAQLAELMKQSRTESQVFNFKNKTYLQVK
ncbi:arylsulfatase [Marinoscillum furvescens]|nr:arylsulfatase [Marinoscillum furvescens]